MRVGTAVRARFEAGSCRRGEKENRDGAVDGLLERVRNLNVPVVGRQRLSMKGRGQGIKRRWKMATNSGWWTKSVCAYKREAGHFLPWAAPSNSAGQASRPLAFQLQLLGSLTRCSLCASILLVAL